MILALLLLFSPASPEYSTQCVDLIDKAGRMQIECEMSQAERYYMDAIHVCGKSAFLYGRLGTTRYLMGRDDQARRDYAIAINSARKMGKMEHAKLLISEMKSLESTPRSFTPCNGQAEKKKGDEESGAEVIDPST